MIDHQAKTAPENPLAADFLQNNLKLLSDKDLPFAGSLIQQYQNKGKLSEKQWYWVEVLGERIKTGHPQLVEGEAFVPAGSEESEDLQPIQFGNTDKLKALFAAAKQAKLKHPAFVLSLGTTDAGTFEIRVYQAGPSSKYEGSFYVCDHVNKEWIGRIHNGTYTPNKRFMGGKQPEGLDTLLLKLLRDPQATVAEYGFKTGRCCFCYGGLTDPKSVEAGYGRVCAKKWGLPYGEALKQFKAEAV